MLAERVTGGSATPSLAAACSACGLVLPSEKWVGCSGCYHARYCTEACRLLGWGRGHHASCGATPPTRAWVSSADAPTLISVCREYGPAHSGLALHCLSRLLALVPKRGERKAASPPPEAERLLQGVVLCMRQHSTTAEVLRVAMDHLSRLASWPNVLVAAGAVGAIAGALAVTPALDLSGLLLLKAISAEDDALCRRHGCYPQAAAGTCRRAALAAKARRVAAP